MKVVRSEIEGMFYGPLFLQIVVPLESGEFRFNMGPETPYLTIIASGDSQQYEKHAYYSELSLS